MKQEHISHIVCANFYKNVIKILDPEVNRNEIRNIVISNNCSLIDPSIMNIL